MKIKDKITFIFSLASIFLIACEKDNPKKKIHFKGTYYGSNTDVTKVQLYSFSDPDLFVPGQSILCADSISLNNNSFDFEFDNCNGQDWNKYPLFINLPTQTIGFDPAAIIDFSKASNSGFVTANINLFTTQFKNYLKTSCIYDSDAYQNMFNRLYAVFPYTDSNGKTYSSYDDLTILNDSDVITAIGKPENRTPLGTRIFNICNS